MIDRVEGPFPWWSDIRVHRNVDLQSGWVHGQVCDNGSVVATMGSHSQEAPMGNKDKGGRHTKTTAIKNLKEKRLEKKAKRTAADAKRNRAD